ncbi:hypothetical protein D3C86_2136890 [compost metagenome]
MILSEQQGREDDQRPNGLKIIEAKSFANLSGDSTNIDNMKSGKDGTAQSPKVSGVDVFRLGSHENESA